MAFEVVLKSAGERLVVGSGAPVRVNFMGTRTNGHKDRRNNIAAYGTNTIEKGNTRSAMQEKRRAGRVFGLMGQKEYDSINSRNKACGLRLHYGAK